MAAMFYSLEEVIEKLGKNEGQIKEQVQQGNLREFRHGKNLLYKVDEVDALAQQSPELSEDDAQIILEEEPQPLADTDASAVLEPQADAELQADASAAEDLQLDTEPQADASGIEELPVDIEPQAEAEPPKEADVPEAAPVASDESELGILSDDLAMDGSEISLDVDETGDLSLAAEALGQEPSLDALTAEDTQASTEGINVLGETDTEYELADDTSAETKLIPDSSGSLDDGGLSGSLDMALDTGEAARLDEDVNLDSFGSGSGLLDLSLQADDTSLGAVLDDIYPETRAAGETPGDPASGVGLAAEAEKIFEESAEDDPAAVGGAMPAGRIAYAEPVPDTLSHACGYALLIPLAAMIYTVIIALSGTQNLAVTIMKPVQDIIWYIVIGASVAVLAIIGIGAFLGKKPADKTKPKGEVYEKNGKK